MLTFSGYPQHDSAAVQRRLHPQVVLQHPLVQVHQQPPVQEVTCNAARVPSHGSRQALERAQHGWWWDGTKEMLTIVLPQTAQALTGQVRSVAP